jgi:hypothetical protein
MLSFSGCRAARLSILASLLVSTAAAQNIWCDGSIQGWSGTFTITGHGGPNTAFGVGTVDYKISGKINFNKTPNPEGNCLWYPSAFGPGDVSASVSIVGTTNPNCPITETIKGMGATGSGLTPTSGAFLDFYGSQVIFFLGILTLDSAHGTFGSTVQCSGVTTSRPVPIDIGPACIVSCNTYPHWEFPFPVGGPKSFSVTTQIQAEDQYGDPQMVWTLTLNLTPVQCSPPVTFNVQPYAGLPRSQDGHLTTMNAFFYPTDSNGSVMTLAAAADACGFAGFDWMQTVLQSLGGEYSYSDCKNAGGVPTATPPSFCSAPINPLTGSYLDPPPGDYTYDYLTTRLTWLSFNRRNFANSYPFYYSPLDLGPAYLFSQDTGCAESDGLGPSAGCARYISTTNTLWFYDKPANTSCAPSANCFAFTTALVGICGPQSTAPCNSATSSVPYPSATLFQWTWKSNFTGSGSMMGGVYDVNVVSDPFPPVPGTGTGGVTITNINGVPALRFVPMTPCRAVDTRNSVGPFGGPELLPATSRNFVIPNSACGVPSTAAAYSLNVTVVPDAQLGYLTIWPTGQNRPLVSTLNSIDGRIKANAAVVPAGTGGAVSVYVTNATHLALDINGYFVPVDNTSSGLEFYPLSPCRIADTRQGTGPLAGPFLSGGGAGRAFPILSSTCNVPSTAQAYSLNFTAVPHGALGYITVWPSGQNQPLVSTLNALTGAIVANAAIVPAGTSGNVSIYASNNTDLVIDIDGYFAPPGNGGLSLYTLPPCRVLDTRNRQDSPPFNGTITVNVAGSGCGTTAAQAYVLNSTVVPPGPLGYLTMWPTGQAQPLVSTLNALDGAITSNMAIVPSVNGSIDAFGANSTQLVLDISAYFAP